jgi:hypothetical protein
MIAYSATYGTAYTTTNLSTYSAAYNSAEQKALWTTFDAPD